MHRRSVSCDEHIKLPLRSSKMVERHQFLRVRPNRNHITHPDVYFKVIILNV